MQAPQRKSDRVAVKKDSSIVLLPDSRGQNPPSDAAAAPTNEYRSFVRHTCALAQPDGWQHGVLTPQQAPVTQFYSS